MIPLLTFSNIYKILNIVAPCVQQIACFRVLDHVSIKEAIYIQREQPSLNQQLHHVNLKFSQFHAFSTYHKFNIYRFVPV